MSTRTIILFSSAVFLVTTLLANTGQAKGLSSKQQTKSSAELSEAFTSQTQTTVTELPSDAADIKRIPGDQFKPEIIPGDQFTPELIPGDQFAPEAIPGDQFKPKAPNQDSPQ